MGTRVLKALSIRQPWAWLILHAGKDIENRTWSSHLHGRFLIHAAQSMTPDDYADAKFTFLEVQRLGKAPAALELPSPTEFERGGIVGAVSMVACYRRHPSPWFCGPKGFKLVDPEVLPFRELRGQLGFFNVPEEVAVWARSLFSA